MKFILAKDLSATQFAQAQANDWHVMYSPEQFVYPVVSTRDCRQGAGQCTCANCKVVCVRSRVFVRKSKLSGQQAIPNIFGGA